MVVRYKLRLYILVLVAAAGFCALLMKLWNLQIDDYEVYSQRVPGTSHVTVRLPGIRGEIKDRNGITLVTNETNFEVLFDLREVVRAYRAQHTAVPKFRYTFTDTDGVRRESEPEVDIVQIVKEMIIPGLEELGLAVNFNSEALRVHYRSTSGVVPYTYRRDLTFEEFATFAEHNLGLPGVSVSVRPTRRYIYGSLASHILGYVRLPDIDLVPVEERKAFDFYVGDDLGQAGIEKAMDRYLRARHGQRILLKDEKGNIMGEVGYEDPGKGSDVYLTIDARIQWIAENALREGNIGRGAVVVLDPSNGDILAMASVPSFDPNKFIPTIAASDWKTYLGNQTHPLTNRAVSPYAPGSTFKIPVALAGCYAGVANRGLTCDGGQQYGSKFMKCWIHSKGGSHGRLDVSEAIKVSCNDFFYQYGNIAGIKAIKTVGTMLGLGEKTGIPLDGEDPGRLPDPDWLRATQGIPWTDGWTANIAIGQGVNEATPLQMAGVTATVANGGTYFRPWLVSAIVEPDGARVGQARPVPIDLTREGLDAGQIEMVRKGMWKVVNEAGGTARLARSKGFDTAGKTGTAQFERKGKPDNHAWFICFAPYDEPKLAICVFVQGGKSGGGVAAPIAAKVIEESMALEKGYEIKLAAVEEAAGSFDPVDAVTFDATAAAEFLEDGDGDTGTQVAVRQSAPRQSRPVAEPSVRLEADAGGSVVPRAEPVTRREVRFKRNNQTERGRGSFRSGRFR